MSLLFCSQSAIRVTLCIHDLNVENWNGDSLHLTVYCLINENVSWQEMNLNSTDLLVINICIEKKVFSSMLANITVLLSAYSMNQYQIVLVITAHCISSWLSGLIIAFQNLHFLYY